MKLGKEEILHIRAMAALTSVDAVDCLVEESSVSFLVQPGQMGVAIGKKGSTIKNLRQRIGKNVEVYEYQPNAADFVKCAFRGIDIDSAEVDSPGSTLYIGMNSTNKRRMLQELGTLSRVRKIVKKTYGINEVRLR